MQQVILAIALLISSMIFAQTATNKSEEGISCQRKVTDCQIIK